MRSAFLGLKRIQTVQILQRVVYGMLRLSYRSPCRIATVLRHYGSQSTGVEEVDSAFGTLSPNNALGGALYRELSVAARRLDEIDLPPVGFVKIDVEGHEEAVLRGGEHLLRRDRPIYMIEIEERHNCGSFGRTTAYFNDLGYEGLFFDGSVMCRILELDEKTLPFCGQLYINNFFSFRRHCPRPKSDPSNFCGSGCRFERVSQVASQCGTTCTPSYLTRRRKAHL
jgi:hypothetical protein